MGPDQTVSIYSIMLYTLSMHYYFMTSFRDNGYVSPRPGTPSKTPTTAALVGIFKVNEYTITFLQER